MVLHQVQLRHARVDGQTREMALETLQFRRKPQAYFGAVGIVLQYLAYRPLEQGKQRLYGGMIELGLAVARQLGHKTPAFGHGDAF